MNSHRKKPDIVVICGPTGIGKTATAIALARIFHGEIISADSMQIYRHMDIGTAKPTPEERTAAPHHLIDIADPDEPFDAARYAREARAVIAAVVARNALPIVTGGTGLYIKSLTQGIFRAKPVDPALRERLKQEVDRMGAPALHRRLQERDPITAGRIHPNDAFRIIRAIEIFETTGKPLSDHHSTHRFGDAPFRTLKIGLEMERSALYERIDRRVDIMLAMGLAAEVRGLLELGYPSQLKSMKSIGYRHMADFIEGRTTWAEAVRTLKRDTRRYAKRQYTWFRADPEVWWVPPHDLETMRNRILEFLTERGRPRTQDQA
ncbi:tRNA (adenosine(37)-N6)-dimethylallyltransferase MiaA [Desulfococcus sp.]|uniref:tRNA (adenosine(37)-N6)-dimethylallyltransferase MiaA n=1 Tax=Desulfococcus sp. TaxID=2025834 RepID=UPI003D0E5933